MKAFIYVDICRYLSSKFLLQQGRILWYQDIARGLVHIHKLGVAHSDLRIDNLLFDQHGHAFLCDFSAASPFGHSNPARPTPGFPVPINGLSEVVSDATDRFAMGSLIFQMEQITSPKLKVAENGSLILPIVRTRHYNMDTVIRKAWLGQYSSTAHMLKDLESLQLNAAQDTRGPMPQILSRGSLRNRVRHWREGRDKQLGMQPLNNAANILSFRYPQFDVYF